jgi:hypothetical protein
LAVARGIERRYLDLGGWIRCRQRAARVIVEGSRAAGIALEDGSEVRADIACLERLHPGIGSQVEAVDAATPQIRNVNPKMTEAARLMRGQELRDGAWGCSVILHIAVSSKD